MARRFAGPETQVKIASSEVRIVKELIVFDLDGTLAESKSPLDAEMSALLHELLGIVKVAVISGALGRSLKSNYSPIFPMTNGWRISLCFQRVGHSSSDTARVGRRSIRKTSPRMNEPRS
jgi:hypothetical protein